MRPHLAKPLFRSLLTNPSIGHRPSDIAARATLCVFCSSPSSRRLPYTWPTLATIAFFALYASCTFRAITPSCPATGYSLCLIEGELPRSRLSVPAVLPHHLNSSCRSLRPPAQCPSVGLHYSLGCRQSLTTSRPPTIAPTCSSYMLPPARRVSSDWLAVAYLLWCCRLSYPSNTWPPTLSSLGC